jgi:hypothetical protein
MDFTPIIAQVWGTLGWFIPLMLLTGLLKSPWAKGQGPYWRTPGAAVCPLAAR